MAECNIRRQLSDWKRPGLIYIFIGIILVNAFGARSGSLQGKIMKKLLFLHPVCLTSSFCHFISTSHPKMIPVIRFCCSCFQSGWAQAINTWDKTTAVSNWISFFLPHPPPLQESLTATELESGMYLEVSFLTAAHSCFLDETPFPPEQRELHAAHTKLQPSLVAISCLTFSEQIQLCSTALHYTFIPIVRCIVRRIIRMVGMGKIYLAWKITLRSDSLSSFYWLCCQRRLAQCKTVKHTAQHFPLFKWFK